MSITQYFALIAMLGISDHGNRSIAAVRDDKKNVSKRFWNIYIIQLITSILSILVYVIACDIYLTEYYAISLLQIIYLISFIFDINWFFWGLEKFKITVTRNFFIKIVSIILIFSFVKERSDLPQYVLIVSLSALVSNAILLFFIRKEIIWVKPCTKDILTNIKPCLTLFIPLVARSIFVFMDKILLGNLCPISQVGFYENAEKIILAPTSILTALGTVMLPKLSNLIYNKQFDTVKQYTQISMNYIMFLGCGFSFGVAAVAPIFAPIFLGAEFQPCGTIMQVMSFTILPVGIANVLRTQCLIPRHCDFSYVISVGLGAVVNLIIDLLLIPNLGAVGASIGWLAAEIVITIYQSIVARKWLPVGQFYKENSVYFLNGLIMFYILWLLAGNRRPSILLLVILIIVGVTVYVGLFIFYIMTHKDSSGYKLIQEKIYNIKKKKVAK